MQLQGEIDRPYVHTMDNNMNEDNKKQTWCPRLWGIDTSVNHAFDYTTADLPKQSLKAGKQWEDLAK